MPVELVPPMYSPESAYERLQAADTDTAQQGDDTISEEEAELCANATEEQNVQPGKADCSQQDDQDVKNEQEFIEGYCRHIEKQLENSSAVVIASADVNPVTEFLLHRIYQVATPKTPFGRCDLRSFTGYVAIKRRPDPPSSTAFARLFYQQEEQKESHKPDRGFRRHAGTSFAEDEVHLAPYFSQDDHRAGDETFDLLGHIVVARNPADRTDQAAASNFVVVLNGVSGPATFALAQILTGGRLQSQSSAGLRASTGDGAAETRAEHISLMGDATPEGSNIASERMLQKINRVFEDNPRCAGVEAIVRVTVSRNPERTESAFGDSRQVESWDFIVPPKEITAGG
jgi:hypothetical protein